LARIKGFRGNRASKKTKKIWGFARRPRGRDLTSRPIFHYSCVPLFTIQNEFRYEIVRKIFEGGMGVVYEAEQHGSREFRQARRHQDHPPELRRARRCSSRISSARPSSSPT
jgi:hypothetical protein